jgi:hypothetical protein
VIGDVPAASAFEIFHAFLPQNIFASQQIGAIAAAAQRNHVRMLAQQQNVSDSAGFARRNDAFLQLPRIGVRNQAKIDDCTIAQIPAFHAQRS